MTRDLSKVKKMILAIQKKPEKYKTYQDKLNKRLIRLALNGENEAVEIFLELLKYRQRSFDKVFCINEFLQKINPREEEINTILDYVFSVQVVIQESDINWLLIRINNLDVVKGNLDLQDSIKNRQLEWEKDNLKKDILDIQENPEKYETYQNTLNQKLVKLALSRDSEAIEMFLELLNYEKESSDKASCIIEFLKKINSGEKDINTILEYVLSGQNEINAKDINWLLEKICVLDVVAQNAELKTSLENRQNEFVQNHFEEIINDVFSSKDAIDSSKLRQIPENLIPKIFMMNEEQEVDIDRVIKNFEFLKNKFNNINGFYFTKYILKEIPESFIEENTELFVSLIGENFSAEYSEYILANFKIETIQKLEKNLNFNISARNLEYYMRYFEHILLYEENAIIEHEWVIEICNLIDIQSNEDKRTENVRERIANKRKEAELPKMDKYSQYIPLNYSQDFPQMDEATFETFVKDLSKLKLLKGKIPEEYCDYIINQKLNKDSYINKKLDRYLPVLKRVFEDKASHILEQNGIKGYNVSIEENLGWGVLGEHSITKRTIKFTRDSLKNLSATDIHILNTLFHEIQHAIQSKNYATEDFAKLDGTLYNMIKEEIIREKNREYYNINYTRMYCEIDARLAGAKGHVEYLRFLGISEEQIIQFNILDEIQLKDYYTHMQKIEEENKYYAVNKVDKNGNIESISEKANELIKNDPSLLKRYPVLALEFNESGERKSLKEILMSATNSDKSLQDIYMKIFDSNVEVGANEITDCLNYVSELLEAHKDGKTEIIESYINLIIENQVIYSLSKAETNTKNFKQVISELRNFANKYSNLNISSLINEKLEQLSQEGFISMDIRQDQKTTEIAIERILKTPINSINEFNEFLEKVQKIMSDDLENYAEKLCTSLERIFSVQMKNKSKLDLNYMLEQCMKIISDSKVQMSFLNKILNDKNINNYPQLREDIMNIQMKFLRKMTLDIEETPEKYGTYKYDLNQMLTSLISNGEPQAVEMFLEMLKYEKTPSNRGYSIIKLLKEINPEEKSINIILDYVFSKQNEIEEEDIDWILKNIKELDGVKKGKNLQETVKNRQLEWEKDNLKKIILDIEKTPEKYKTYKYDLNRKLIEFASNGGPEATYMFLEQLNYEEDSWGKVYNIKNFLKATNLREKDINTILDYVFSKQNVIKEKDIKWLLEEVSILDVVKKDIDLQKSVKNRQLKFEKDSLKKRISAIQKSPEKYEIYKCDLERALIKLASSGEPESVQMFLEMLKYEEKSSYKATYIIRFLEETNPRKTRY